jgi:cell pole-organizing protein PopZ
MEEILASIRRILKDEQSGEQDAPPQAAEDEDILVLDSSMVVKPAPAPVFHPEPIELEPAYPPAAYAPPAAEPAAYAPPAPFFETPLHETEPAAAPQAADAFDAEEEPPPHLTSEPSEPDYPAAENVTFDLPPLDDVDNGAGSAEEIYMPDDNEQNFQAPHGLVGEAASEAAASSIGSLIRSISSERQIAIGRPGLTLEDLVREELRPLLKSWLDSNLPALVERIVRAEIQRVVERSI